MAQYVAVRALSRSTNIRVKNAFAETQQVKVDATGGQFKLTYNGQQTADIAFNATAATVQSALVALNNIAPDDIFVTGGPGNSGGTTPYIVNFTVDGVIGADAVQLTGQNGTTPLSGGGAAVTVTTLGSIAGGAPIKLSPTSDVVIDLDNVENRRALARHSAVGQYIVSAANAFDGAIGLPSND